ncbi:MAG TPA: amino acid adenylation domain-containing protein [Bryobacteraceae bacterium]|nr:amino acid adenylation domain-containing protein [Bryobacteraceae bacterium]
MPRNPSIYAPPFENQTLPQLFEQQAAKMPHATAVAFGAQKLQYKELNYRANQVARYLGDRGAGPGSLVGIGVERSLEMIGAILGILKTGAAYVPLDPSYPKDRLAWMLSDCGAPILLTVSSVTDRFSAYGGLVLCLDREWPAIRREKTNNLECRAQCGDRAYVMYTSGSAGWPKGVQIAHRGVVNAAHAMRAKIGMDTSDVLVSVSSLSFDIHVLDVWMPLACGACVVVAPAAACRDGGELANEIARAGGTVMQATPSTWQLLLDSGWAGSRRLTAVCGGEALASELAGRLGEKVKALWNAYGPTETTVWSAAYRVGGREDIVPIGRPLANTQFHVLDDHRRPAPAGVAGELYIGGDGLALGYLNLPELTAERFIIHPFDRVGGRRLYRTGDRVRQRPDGNFEFLGRLDHQVKLRGFRIELDEISAVLRRHPGVKEAVTTLNEQSGGYKHLAAYVVTTPDDSAKPEELRNFLRATLPDYMVPTRLTFLDALPRLPNGKVDYRGLSEPELGEIAPNGDSPAPNDALEQGLAGIFEELLGRGPVNTRQSFFDLGGDSVLVARLLRRIEGTVGTRLTMATVFQASTIEQLAHVLRDHPGVIPSTGVIPIQTGGSGPPFLCLGAGPSFVPLVRLVSGSLRFLGLDLGLIDPTQIPQPYRLEDIAAQVAQRIGELEPQGPYYLGGWCRYGPLAYETARQLTAQGDEMALLTLIDSANPRYYRDLPAAAKVAIRAQRLEYHLANLTRSRAAEIPRYLRDRFRVLRYRMNGLRARVRHYAGRDGGASIEELERILHSASAHYDPPPYAGRVAIFQSIERPRGCYWDLQAGWRDLVEGQMEVYDVPGGHESMFQEPNLEIFASQMRQCLRLERYIEAEAG